MAPAIGSLNVKTILIEKNDNAEGTVQFKEDKFTGSQVVFSPLSHRF